MIFTNKTVLITGGTGFLGRALVKEILKQKPSSIRIFSRDEVKHHQVLELFNYDERIRTFIGDVRDRDRLRKSMRGADIVIHAAALKRLDILEYNVEESIKTNIMGTFNVVDAALEMDVEKAIFVSTDKACSPVNTYGACKFVGERLFTESNYSKGDRRTVFSVVRYGNVLESTGSVIPFFTQKIKDNEKIPLTDKRMTRFIITSEQAVKLVFDAVEHSVGGEIFIPKLPAFKIMDLIELLKEKFNAKNEIEVIGVRPGEKYHELMINNCEIPWTYRFKNYFIITSQIMKYQEVKPHYISAKNKLDEKEMQEYNSGDNVVSLDELRELFRNYGLL